MQRIAVEDCTYADGSLELGEVFFCSCRYREKTRQPNSTIHHISTKRDLADKMARRRGGEVEYQTNYTVRFQWVVGRRAACQTAAVLLSFRRVELGFGRCLIPALFRFFS